MDDKTFDSLIRDAGSRRAAVKGLVGGLLGFGIGRQATAAQVGAEACKIRRCKKAVLDQECLDRNGNPDNHMCCQGLTCDNSRGACTFQNGSGGDGDFCRNNRDCDSDFFCKKNQCVPNKCGGS